MPRDTSRHLLQVDYMLATSGCRVRGYERWAFNALAALMGDRHASWEDRASLARERAACGKGAQLPAALRLDLPKVRPSGARTSISGGKGNTYVTVLPFTEHTSAVPGLGSPSHDFEARVVSLSRAADAVARVRAVAPQGARVRAYERFVIATTGGQSDAQLSAINEHLERALAFFVNEYDLLPPENFITLYIVPKPGQAEVLSAAIHGMKLPPRTLGYAFEPDQSIVATTPDSRTGTVTHELFHLLARNSSQSLPSWLDEGLAGLYEAARFEGGRLVGYSNWRNALLYRFPNARPRILDLLVSDWATPRTNRIVEKALNEYEAWESAQRRNSDGGIVIDSTRGPRTPPSTEAVQSIADDERAFREITARPFVQFLQDQGHLSAVVRAFQQMDPGEHESPEAAALAVLASIVGHIDEVQHDFDVWFDNSRRDAPPLSEEAEEYRDYDSWAKNDRY